MKNIRTLMFIIAIALIFASCNDQTDDPIQTELQGTWAGTSQGISMTISFNNNSGYFAYSDSTEGYLFTFTSTTDSNPKTLDLLLIEDVSYFPDNNFEDVSCLGIYKIEAQQLTIIANVPGNPLRPADFSDTTTGLRWVFSKTDLPASSRPSTSSYNCADSPSLVLSSPIDDAPSTILAAYYNVPNSQPITPDNPQGLHPGWDFCIPAGTVVKASVPGIVVSIQTLIDSGLEHQVVLVKSCHGFKMNYNLEPATSISVVRGQVLEIGDTIGYVGTNPMSLKPGSATLDYRLHDRTNTFICMTPYVTAEFKIMLETWFDRYWTRTADHPGPCPCHYQFP